VDSLFGSNLECGSFLLVFSGSFELSFGGFVISSFFSGSSLLDVFGSFSSVSCGLFLFFIVDDLCLAG